jgi:hypothetical protein
VLRSSVDSARSLLGTIAGATISAAALVFSVTVLSVQLASAQFSPRVVRGYLRDDLRKWATGFMVATFTYALLVLRAVRVPESGDGEEVVPQIALTVGVVLGSSRWSWWSPTSTARRARSWSATCSGGSPARRSSWSTRCAPDRGAGATRRTRSRRPPPRTRSS